jgi:hypothetical protein
MNTGMWARTAGLSGMLYGADISGISDSMLDKQRSAIATAVSAHGCGKNKVMSLWLHDCTGNRTDPKFHAHEMPIATYAKAIWDEWLPRDLFESAHANATRMLADSKNGWNAVKGPFAAAIKSACRIGWSFNSAFELVTDDGTILDIRDDSPQFIKNEVTKSVRRSIDKEIDAEFPILRSGGRGVPPLASKKPLLAPTPSKN